MPIAGASTATASELFALGKLTEKQNKLRRVVCEELRNLKAFDLSARITTHKLALSLVKYFPEFAVPRDRAKRQGRPGTGGQRPDANADQRHQGARQS